MTVHINLADKSLNRSAQTTVCICTKRYRIQFITHNHTEALYTKISIQKYKSHDARPTSLNNPHTSISELSAQKILVVTYDLLQEHF